MAVYSPTNVSGGWACPRKAGFVKRKVGICSAQMGYSGSQPWYLLVNVSKFPQVQTVSGRLHEKDSGL